MGSTSDLTTQLANSVEDRKVANELLSILRLILDVQVEQQNIHQKNIDLREENYALRKKLDKLNASLIEDMGTVTYRKPSYYVSKDGAESGPYCQRCYDSDKKLIRLQQDDGNDQWDCLVCDKTYWGPNYVTPTVSMCRY